jgi:hypothetical protein
VVSVIPPRLSHAAAELKSYTDSIFQLRLAPSYWRSISGIVRSTWISDLVPAKISSSNASTSKFAKSEMASLAATFASTKTDN